MKLLDFNLEKALKNPERVFFEDGSKAVDFKYFPTASTEFNLFVQSEKGNIFRYTKNGKSDLGGTTCLKLLPLTKTYHYCIFLNSYGGFGTSLPFKTKEEMRIFMKLQNNKVLEEHSYTIEIPG